MNNLIYSFIFIFLGLVVCNVAFFVLCNYKMLIRKYDENKRNKHIANLLNEAINKHEIRDMIERNNGCE